MINDTLDELDTESRLVQLGLILPQGNDLKPLLGHPDVTPAFLREMLRNRGVLFCSDNKLDLISHFIQMVLTPLEFEQIIHKVKTREESYKERNETIYVNDGEMSLVDIFDKGAIDVLDVGKDPYGNYGIKGQPVTEFEEENGIEKVKISYSISKRSLSSDYIQGLRTFRGEVEMVKKQGSAELLLNTKHSSNETNTINKQAFGAFRKKLKDENIISDKPSQKITFGCFTNEQRVKFLLHCMDCSSHGEFEFDKIIDLELKPDESMDLSKHVNLKWLENKVSTLHLKGKALEETFFMTDPKCHPFIKIWRFECKFKFQNRGGKCSFKVTFGFDKYGIKSDDSCPFQLAITDIHSPEHQKNTTLYRSLRDKLSSRLHEVKQKSYLKNRSNKSI